MSIRESRRYGLFRSGFSVVEVLIAITLIALAIGLILPAFGTKRINSRGLHNNTQIRGIQQGFVVYAQSNKKGGGDGFFPGLDSSGKVLPDGEATAYSGDGTEPAARLAIMLNGNYFTPEYIINPADTRATEAFDQIDPDTGDYRGLTREHHSYALLGIAEALDQTEEGLVPEGDGRFSEWKETLNTSAIVIGDRAIGTGRADISSVWTERGSGDWRGGVTKNDNSTSFETQAEFEDTKYGHADVNELDHLFEDAPGMDDALLVHQDAVTAYSVD